MPFLEDKTSQKMPGWEVLQLGRQSKQNTTPSENCGFTFGVNSNGAAKNMRHGSTKCEINLLHEVQEKCPQCKQPTQTQILEDNGHYKHTISRYLESIPQHKRRLTYKCIVNSNAANIKAPTTLISLKYTQCNTAVTHAALHTVTFVHGCLR